MSKQEEMKKCPNCNKPIDRIWFTAQMTEEWSWHGYHWECTAHHSLVADPQHPVICPYCEREVGTGRDFGFGE
jgi:endogenous inhibitor of DNA gyrase (YacG/DUF329 family)